MEAAAGSSKSNDPSRRRQAKKRMPPPALLRVRRCHRAIVAPFGRSPLPAGAKRTRAAALAPCSPDRNNGYRTGWANLGYDMAGLIADRLLAHDVADYLRFRAVCGSWRLCTADPNTHGRRFHPRHWILLLETNAAPDRRRFLNLSTGDCIQVSIPELRDHMVLGHTCKGLLVLLHHDHAHVRLLNPLTRRLTQLPPLTKLLPKEEQDHHLLHSPLCDNYFAALGSGILHDGDSTVVLSFNLLDIIGVAKPGDARWTLLRFRNRLRTTSAMFAGRFYCTTEDGLMVLKDQLWRLEVAAKLHTMRIIPMADSVHLVENNAGELMLVHRRFSRNLRNYNKRRYDVYRVDLDAGTLRRVNSLGDGGYALFIGMRWSISVPINAFPAGSISGDTIYLKFDIDERDETEGCHIADKSIKHAARYYLDPNMAAQPHTLVHCLSLCKTGQM